MEQTRLASLRDSRKKRPTTSYFRVAVSVREGGSASTHYRVRSLPPLSCVRVTFRKLRHQPTDRLVGDSSVVSSIIYEVADKREVRKKATELDLTGFQPERVISR